MSNFAYSGGVSVEELRQRVGAAPIHKLNSNESPYPPSPRVLAAIAAAAPELNYYPQRTDDAFCKTLADFHGRGLTAEHFVSADSGVALIEMIIQAFAAPGDEVIVCPPLFGWYVIAATRNDAVVVQVPFMQPDFQLDVDGILSAVTSRTRLLFLTNPNNPTGTMTDAVAMDKLVRGLLEHVTLLADEVYHHFVERADYPDTLAYVQEGCRVLILHSFSKAYGLAGLRLGYVIAPPALTGRLRALKRPFHTNRLAFAAGTAALEDQAHVARTVELVRTEKQFLYDAFARLGVRYWASETNFVLWQAPAGRPDLETELLTRGVIIRATQKSGLDAHFRVTVGLPESNRAFIVALTALLDQ